MHFFIVSRYIFFGLSIALNVAIATLAAWNSQFIGVSTGIDVYLIVISILGVLLIFPIIFVELVRKGAFTSRVWFEVGWVALFWLLQLAGAAAYTAVQPHTSCGAIALRQFADACYSSRVVLGFLWPSAFLSLAYLLTLVIVTILHTKDVPRVWTTGVRDVDWFAGVPQKIASPVLPVFQQHSMKSNATLASIQSGTVSIRPLILAEKTLAPAAPQPPIVAPTWTRSPPVVPPTSTHDTPPLYPQFVQPLVKTKPIVLVGPGPLPVGQLPPSSAQAAESQEQRPATSTTTPSTSHSPSSSASSLSGLSSASAPTPSRPDSHMGLRPLVLPQSMPQPPQPRSASAAQNGSPASARPKHRPPPLNLSTISSFNSNKKGRQDRPARR